MGKRKAICLISGGMDSAVATAIAYNDNYEIYGLTFDYGQRNIKEIDSAVEIANHFNAECKIIKVDLRQIGGSSLTDNIPVPENINPGIIPVTYVPARNTIFLSLALAYSEVKNADAIFMGINAVDYSGYPDCRPEYVEAFQNLANLSTKRGVEGETIEIKAPLLYLSKEKILKKGLELNVPFEKTWSCYKEGEKPCGKCASCLIRKRAFEKVGLSDESE